MRRAIASLVLLAISLPLIAPALMADPVSNLPACCRRFGKHHCMAAGGGAGSPAAPSVRTLRIRCPLFPAGPSTQAASKVILRTAAQTGQLSFCGFTARSLNHRPVRAVLTDPTQKRGPPASFGQTRFIVL